MNSFRAVERAMAYEAQRQYEVWQETGKRLGDVPKSTRGWDEATQTTYLQRDEGGIQRLPLFPRARPGAGHLRPTPRSSGSARRWANCRPRLRRGWKRPTASRPTTATCW